jgi:hypothetical protein
MPYCKSCETEHEIEFKFCPNCGAHEVQERLTISQFLKEFLHVLTNFEGPVWNTLKDLTLLPRKVTHGYITGIRMKYLTPARYLVIAFTLSGLFFVLFQDQFEQAYANQFLSGFEEGYTGSTGEELPESSEKSEEAEAFITKLQYIFQKYTNLLGFLYIPFFALFGKWWLNKNNKYNLAESFVIATYLHSHTALLMIPFYIITVIPGVNFLVFTSIIAYTIILFFVWLVKQSYQTSIWRSLLTVIFTYILYYFFVGLGIALYIMIPMFSEKLLG